MAQVTREQYEKYATVDLLDGYSDCYKSLYNFRPHIMPSREDLINFWLNYEENFERAMKQEAEDEAYYAELEAEYEAEQMALRQDKNEMSAIGFLADKAYNMGVSMELLDGWC